MIPIGRTCAVVSLASALLAGAAFASTDRAPVWKSIGPEGGISVALAVHPTKPGTAFCGAQFGGVYRTTNSGASWQPVGRGVIDLEVFSLHIPKRLPNTIYVGTARGVYKSIDGGAAWIQASGDLLKERNIWGIAAHPKSPRTVWAATGGRGVYKSTNGGASWKWMSNSLSYKSAWSLGIDKNGVLYAGVEDEGLYKSVNGGASWKLVGNKGFVRAFAVDAVNPLIIYLAADRNWKSLDGGSTWKALPTTLPSDICAIVVDPRASGTLYLATQYRGIYKSADFAETLTPVNDGLTDIYVNALAIAPSRPTVLYAGTLSAGLFRSMNGGGAWTAVNKGFRAQDIKDIAFDAKTAGVLYVGTGTGLFKGTGGGPPWRSLNAAPYPAAAGCESVAVDARNPAVIYAGSYYQGMFKTTDGGQTWTKLSLTARITSVVLDPADPDRIFATTFGSGLYRSTNAGRTWAQAGFKDSSPGGVVFDTSRPGTVYVWTGSSLWRGTATGKTWKKAGAPYAEIYQLTIAPDGTMYAGTGGSGVFKSVNQGKTWTEINDGLPSCRYIDAFAIHPANPLHLYAGVSNLGVYRSRDGGSTWSYMGAGLCPDTMIFSLAFDPKDPATLYAGTNGAGVYKIKPGA